MQILEFDACGHCAICIQQTGLLARTKNAIFSLAARPRANSRSFFADADVVDFVLDYARLLPNFPAPGKVNPFHRRAENCFDNSRCATSFCCDGQPLFLYPDGNNTGHSFPPMPDKAEQWCSNALTGACVRVDPARMHSHPGCFVDDDQTSFGMNR